MTGRCRAPCVIAVAAMALIVAAGGLAWLDENLLPHSGAAPASR